MRNFKTIILVFVASLAWAQTPKKLVWEENFNNTELNEKVWNFELGDGCPNICGWGNNESQFYTKENHEIKDGILIIHPKKENEKYTSTRITTKDKKEFQYGRMEVRAKLPAGKGLWPAFWMLGSNISKVGWPQCGEIDILEYVGKNPGTIYTTLHTTDSHGESKNSKITKIENIENGFHIYAIDWTKDKIDFYVDQKLVYTFAPKNKTEEIWPYNQPFYFIINVAIGGNR
jgi:beta-glucanase (GH16 family)